MRIDGKAIAEAIYTKLRTKIQTLRAQNIIPHLAVILVGEDHASHAYVKQKKLRGEEVGMIVTVHQYPETVTTKELLKTITRLNADPSVHGIVIQQPLPDHVDVKQLIDATAPQKDVDGFHAASSFQPPIADATITILTDVFRHEKASGSFEDWLREKTITVAGKGETGGRPIISRLEKMGCHPRIIDRKTRSQKELLQDAAIVISCIGRPHVLQVSALPKGVILLCIGMFRGEDGKLHGDYETADIEPIASYYTPVPGGIGPVNVACLLTNVVSAAMS